ncbi:DOMON-like domain-containing protein [Sphingomonas sp. TF3]|uniref:DOMON-like domain-containing protein n=1 Tax=Sphingomonas sp. TF3 TaxID=2495580 RepID=UPI000F891AB0|nr:DOMON-like domain-containing protein [Sphingomonas sp. TF3]RUN78148.1 DOMON-like domain-containing protein [Sphingomonas sp. TF3]
MRSSAITKDALMQEYELVPHPDTPPAKVEAVRVRIVVREGALLLTFIVHGNDHVALPDWATSTRRDDLWKTTCGEMFLGLPGSEVYVEFNYSPSTQWAAYRFDAHRAGGRDLPLSTPPLVDRGDDTSDYLVEVEQPLSDLPGEPFDLGLTAVIEETDGTKSYWALAHAPGPPDFHNRDCFIATLPAPERP